MLRKELRSKKGTSKEKLGGTVGQEYAEMQVNITFTDGEITDNQEAEKPQEENRLYAFIRTLIDVVCSFLSYVVNLFKNLV